MAEKAGGVATRAGVQHVDVRVGDPGGAQRGANGKGQIDTRARGVQLSGARPKRLRKVAGQFG